MNCSFKIHGAAEMLVDAHAFELRGRDAGGKNADRFAGLRAADAESNPAKAPTARPEQSRPQSRSVAESLHLLPLAAGVETSLDTARRRACATQEFADCGSGFILGSAWVSGAGLFSSASTLGQRGFCRIKRLALGRVLQEQLLGVFERDADLPLGLVFVR